MRITFITFFFFCLIESHNNTCVVENVLCQGTLWAHETWLVDYYFQTRAYLRAKISRNYTYALELIARINKYTYLQPCFRDHIICIFHISSIVLNTVCACSCTRLDGRVLNKACLYENGITFACLTNKSRRDWKIERTRKKAWWRPISLLVKYIFLKELNRHVYRTVVKCVLYMVSWNNEDSQMLFFYTSHRKKDSIFFFKKKNFLTVYYYFSNSCDM